MSALDVLAEGLGFPEPPRWHDGRLWLCNWGPGEVLAVHARTLLSGARALFARRRPLSSTVTPASAG